jgi:hypothetical protein
VENPVYFINYYNIKYKIRRAKLSKLQRLACLSSIGVMRMTAEAVAEVLMGSLHYKLGV